MGATPLFVWKFPLRQVEVTTGLQNIAKKSGGTIMPKSSLVFLYKNEVLEEKRHEQVH